MLLASKVLISAAMTSCQWECKIACLKILGLEQIEVERTKDLYSGENLSEEIKEFIE